MIPKMGLGILVLRARGIIRIRPAHGFNPDVINDLAKKTAEFEPEESFVYYLMK